jgi:hypothetical protein
LCERTAARVLDGVSQQHGDLRDHGDRTTHFAARRIGESIDDRARADRNVHAGDLEHDVDARVL